MNYIQYKKELLDDGIISPIKNNENTKKPIVKFFTPISFENFSKDIFFHTNQHGLHQGSMYENLPCNK